MRANVPLLLAACLVLAAAQATHAGLDIELDNIELEPQAVPSRRTLLESSSSSFSSSSYGGGYGSQYGYGRYGTNRRRLMGGYGGYGGYGDYGYGGAYGMPRYLLERDVQLQPFDATLTEEQQRLASASAAAERRAQQQRDMATAGDRAQQQQQEHAEGAQGAVTAAMAAALRSARAAAASSLLSSPAGQCYCRFDPDYNTWALGEEVCKQALYTKCKAEQLPCSWLDAYYGHSAGSAMAHTLPHEQDILGFVFDDCQPHPPCACAGVKFDGSDPVTNSYACCRDLRAACRTPFNGLSCGDVESFCKDDKTSTKLLHWAQHKLHRAAECSAYGGTPYSFVPLDQIIAANRPSKELESGAAVEVAGAEDQQTLVEAMLHRVLPAAGSFSAGSNKVAVGVVGLGGLMVLVALAGMIATLRAQGDDDINDEGDGVGADHVTPLLHPVPELAVRDEEAQPAPLRHIISSNYLLSVPPSRTGSTASISSSAYQQ